MSLPLLPFIPSPGTGVDVDSIFRRFRENKSLHLSGLRGGSLALFLTALHKDRGGRFVIVEETEQRADALARDIGFLCKERDRAIRYPGFDVGPYDEMIPDRRTSIARMTALFQLTVNEDWRFLVLSGDSLPRTVMRKDRLAGACRRICEGDTVRRSELLQLLHQGGYFRTSLVEEPATYAVRGGIIDVFSPCLDAPTRLEFDGDKLERMRLFDPETQITVAPLLELWIHPTRPALVPLSETEKRTAAKRIREICDQVELPTTRTELLIEDLLAGRQIVGLTAFQPAFEPGQATVLDYLPPDVTCFVSNPDGLLANWMKQEMSLRLDGDRRRREGRPAFPLFDHLRDAEDLMKDLLHHSRVFIHPLPVLTRDCDEGVPSDRLHCETEEYSEFSERLKHLLPVGKSLDILPILVTYLKTLAEESFRVVIVAHTNGQVERLCSLLEGRGLSPVCLDEIEPVSPGLYIVRGDLARGFLWPGEALCYLTEEEIFGRRSRRAAKASRRGDILADLRSLTPGELVVHKEHGIGRYEGLVRQSVRNTEVEFLLITFRDADKLYVPVYRLNQVQKYRGGGDVAVRLDKLGGQTFSRTRARARKRAMEIAAYLLNLYARKEVVKKTPLPPVDDLYREFEASFPFEETVDQARVIDEINADLEADRPMDRLVCGDVGFGKTEVAMRAAFRAVMSGRQVAVLVPTTVLAQQHFQSIVRRFLDYPVRVEMLSRFRSTAVNKATVAGLKEGTVDIVIGTHRLLSRDVHFKRLGLLVVDEEHRFGVAHKERIRSLKVSVDTIAMTATPIPRTLHMAFAGIRDLSVISEPPVNRRPIRTMICHDEPSLIKAAIERELAREGQVFFVHNRVRGIETLAARLRKMLPGVQVAVGHGQMSEERLEQVMIDFVAGRYQVLVCTAIIESGLDIQRANTIFIDRADMFGLAQLYQLRGRVGRSAQQAYAYLIVPPIAQLKDDARRRVEALTTHANLGDGFSLATLDLEFRGAGDLLGQEQSGDINTVGFEMYMELIEEASALLQGRAHKVETEPEITLEDPGLLPDVYLPDVGLRLQYYKRLAAAHSDTEVEHLAAELIDRFGPLPQPTLVLIDGMLAKTMCRYFNIQGLEASQRRMVLHLGSDTRVDPVGLTNLIREAAGAVRLTKDLKIIVEFSSDGPGGAAGAIRFLRRLGSYAIKSS